MSERELKKRVIEGTVVSVAMEKTCTVLTSRVYQHPVYKKHIRRTKKYLAHDEKNECKVGDRVRIVETRPLSKRKCWRVQGILTSASA